MRIIFCDNGFNPKEVDYMYAEEYSFAEQDSLSISLISFEELKKGNIDMALRRVKPSDEEEVGIYRGWMLKPSQYILLYEGLLKKKVELINSLHEYIFCHYLPESYHVIKAFTPKTTFKKLDIPFDIRKFQDELNSFGSSPIILKDYVKSQKHYWDEACFIPDASDLEKVESVIAKFLELQGSDINEGLVFREFVELEKLTNHSKSGMPLTKEFRLFILYGKVIASFNYWDEGDYESVRPNIDFLKELIPAIDSNFFTVDIAKRKNGEWIIIELGDGQVAGLPDNANKNTFYKTLKRGK
ncbi:MAG: ATP-grasp domain-containing protein [Bacteroidetes bacterium]|jgi:hypothetical protein|nr:ATP-grasp domain-containing protein [Bacteroidota bacterium]